MAPSIADRVLVRHPELPENGSARMAKADLRFTERRWIGQAIERTRQLAGLSLKEFAAVLQRDERQIARWIDASERAQVETIFAVERFRRLFVVALAEQVSDVEVITTIQVRRLA